MKEVEHSDAIAEEIRGWGKGRWRRMMRRVLRDQVEVDDEGLRVIFEDGSGVELKWNEVREVQVCSMRRPLVGTDVFLVFLGPADKGIPMSYDKAPLDLLVDIEHRLPGFSSDDLMRVVLNVRKGDRYTCWRRQADDGLRGS